MNFEQKFHKEEIQTFVHVLIKYLTFLVPILGPLTKVAVFR